MKKRLLPRFEASLDFLVNPMIESIKELNHAIIGGYQVVEKYYLSILQKLGKESMS